MFYFIDNNYPEVLYFGNQAGFDHVQAEGGCPVRYTPKENVPPGGQIEMQIRMGGEVKTELWDVVEMVR